MTLEIVALYKRADLVDETTSLEELRARITHDIRKRPAPVTA